jgi:hypothetical protein
VVSKIKLTDGVPKRCPGGFCHFWHPVTLKFSKSTRPHTQHRRVVYWRVSLKKDTLAINAMRNLNTATPGEAKQIGSDTASSSTDEISKSLTQQGDKSAKRVAKRLLSLLSLPHIRDLESWPSGQERRAEVFSTRESLVGSPQGSRKRINGGEKGRTNSVLSSVDATSKFLIRRGANSPLQRRA